MDKRAFDTQVNYIMRRIKIEPLPPKLFEFESGPIHFIMRASDERADLRMLIEGTSASLSETECNSRNVCIKLVCDHWQNTDSDAFSVRFLLDSAEMRKRQPLEKYRASVDVDTDPLDPVLSNRQLRPRPNRPGTPESASACASSSRAEASIEVDNGCEHLASTSTSKASKKPPATDCPIRAVRTANAAPAAQEAKQPKFIKPNQENRKFKHYTYDENLKILQWLLSKREEQRIFGLYIWKRFIEDEVLPGNRGPWAIRFHVINWLLNNLDTYAFILCDECWFSPPLAKSELARLRDAIRSHEVIVRSRMQGRCNQRAKKLKRQLNKPATMSLLQKHVHEHEDSEIEQPKGFSPNRKRPLLSSTSSLNIDHESSFEKSGDEDENGGIRTTGTPVDEPMGARKRPSRNDSASTPFPPQGLVPSDGTNFNSSPIQSHHSLEQSERRMQTLEGTSDVLTLKKLTAASNSIGGKLSFRHTEDSLEQLAAANEDAMSVPDDDIYDPDISRREGVSADSSSVSSPPKRSPHSMSARAHAQSSKAISVTAAAGTGASQSKTSQPTRAATVPSSPAVSPARCQSKLRRRNECTIAKSTSGCTNDLNVYAPRGRRKKLLSLLAIDEELEPTLHDEDSSSSSASKAVSSASKAKAVNSGRSAPAAKQRAFTPRGARFVSISSNLFSSSPVEGGDEWALELDGEPPKSNSRARAERETSGKKRIRLSQPVAALRPPSSASDTSATKTNQMGAKSSAPKEFGSRHRGEKDSSTQLLATASDEEEAGEMEEEKEEETPEERELNKQYNNAKMELYRRLERQHKSTKNVTKQLHRTLDAKLIAAHYKHNRLDCKKRRKKQKLASQSSGHSVDEDESEATSKRARKREKRRKLTEDTDSETLSPRKRRTTRAEHLAPQQHQEPAEPGDSAEEASEPVATEVEAETTAMRIAISDTSATVAATANGLTSSATATFGTIGAALSPTDADS